MSNEKKKKPKQNIVKESRLTYDDYASMDDQNRHELVDGQLELMSPSPTTTHQSVIFELLKHITGSCEQDYFIYFAPIDVILSSTEVRQPDLVLINRKRIDTLSNRGIEGAPDLVVEVLSPSSLKRDKIDKLSTYAYFKIPEYWIVDPSTGILEHYILDKNRYEINNIFQEGEQVTSPNIACISFTMKEIMDQIPHLAD